MPPATNARNIFARLSLQSVDNSRSDVKPVVDEASVMANGSLSTANRSLVAAYQSAEYARIPSQASTTANRISIGALVFAVLSILLTFVRRPKDSVYPSKSLLDLLHWAEIGQPASPAQRPSRPGV